MSTPEEMKAVSALLVTMVNEGVQPVILDLGAYHGEDSEWMRAACNYRHLVNVIVEADSRNIEVIRHRFPGETPRILRCEIVGGAIASFTGTTTFYAGFDDRTGGISGSGSIRKPTEHLEVFPAITFPERMQESVACWRLDDLMDQLHLASETVDVLWADLQGAERDMIAGGERTLKNTRYIFIEAEKQAFYEGQAPRPELLAMLPDFDVIAEFDYNLLLKRR